MVAPHIDKVNQIKWVLRKEKGLSYVDKQVSHMVENTFI